MAGRVDAEAIRELFSSFGRVDVRRMFSGAGVFADGLMIAIVVDGVIYLKVDVASVAAFEREGLPPFTYYAAGGGRRALGYRRMPDRLYDDPEELAAWARQALAAAHRAVAGRGSRPRSRKARTVRAP